MNKKLILFVTTSDIMAGAEKNIYDLLRLADKSKFNFKLVIFKKDKNGLLINKVRDLGIPVECLFIQTKWQFYKLYKLWKLIRVDKPYILESFLYFDNQVCRILGYLAEVPIIISGQQNVEIKKRIFREFFDKLTMPLADWLISNTNEGKDYYVNKGYIDKNKVLVAKNGIDLDQLKIKQSLYPNSSENRRIFGISIPNEYKVALAVGFLTEQKGFFNLIQAIKILKNRKQNIMCFVIGDGPLMSILKKEVEINNLTANIFFVGFKAESYQYMRQFDFFVLSSLWEGLPNVLIEAMASKLPVIATQVGGVKDLVENNITGILVRPADINDLVFGIEKMINMRKKDLDFITKNAQLKIEREFNICKMVKNYENCYEGLFL